MVQSEETSAIKRLYYSISEVSSLVDEEQYVLRYWETEFHQLRPQKNRSGNRIYTEKDVGLLRTIKHLLREKRYTVEGAKEHINRMYGETEPAQQVQPSSTNTSDLAQETTSAVVNAHAPTNSSQTPSLASSSTPHSISLSREEMIIFRDALRECLTILEAPKTVSDE